MSLLYRATRVLHRCLCMPRLSDSGLRVLSLNIINSAALWGLDGSSRYAKKRSMCSLFRMLPER
jgi:hypothetical protein